MRTRFLLPAALVAAGCTLGWLAASTRMTEAFAQDTRPADTSTRADGTQLPKPDPAFKGKIGETYKDSTPDYPQPVKAPKGAPNVLLVLLDDVGFGMCSTFGGPVPTPHLDKLAKNGLTYNQFHTTALCSPTRAALLTGRNHHSCGTGVIIEMGTGYPGYTGIIPKSTTVVAQTLRDNGYATAMFGKAHNTPEPEISPAGPFDNWPTGQGFEYFYGFNQGETNQYYPTLYRDTTPVSQPKSPEQGYHFMADMTDEAIAWTHNVRAANPDKPWFNYFSTSGVHAPHHAPKEWRDKYKGKFDHGWDKQRELTHARQLEMGIIPKGTKLTARDESIPSWDTRSADEKKVYTRLMENYAGYMEFTDDQVGRLIDSLAASGELDNTLVMYVVGDNGASAEGGLEGTFSELASLLGVQLGLESTIKRIDEIGGPTSEPHVPVGWAWAMNAPFQWTKQVASHFGGTRNPLVVHWPKRHQSEGRDSRPVPPRHRCRADHSGGVQDPRAEGRERHRAEADRRRLDALFLRRRKRQEQAHDPVLRARDQSGDLPRRLGGVQPVWLSLDDRGQRRRTSSRLRGSFTTSTDDFSQADRSRGERIRRSSKHLQAKFLEEAKKYDVFPLDPRFSERLDPKLRESGDSEDELDVLRQQRLAAGTDRPATVPAPAHHHRRTDHPEGRRGRRHHLRGCVLGGVVALHQGQEAGVPLHVLRHRRRHNPRHGSDSRGQGDAEDRVHPGRLEGRRRHAQVVRQRQAGRRGQAQRGRRSGTGWSRSRSAATRSRPSIRPTRTKANSSSPARSIRSRFCCCDDPVAAK